MDTLKVLVMSCGCASFVREPSHLTKNAWDSCTIEVGPTCPTPPDFQLAPKEPSAAERRAS